MLDELDNNIMKIQFGELSGIGFHIKKLIYKLYQC